MSLFPCGSTITYRHTLDWSLWPLPARVCAVAYLDRVFPAVVHQGNRRVGALDAIPSPVLQLLIATASGARFMTYSRPSKIGCSTAAPSASAAVGALRKLISAWLASPADPVSTMLGGRAARAAALREHELRLLVGELRLLVEQLRSIAVDFGLVDRRIDLGEKLPGLDDRADVHEQLLQLSGDLRADIDVVLGL